MDGHDDGDTMIMGVMKSNIKGKRTKRRRPSPALTLTLASTSSSSTSSTETTAPPNHSLLTSIDFTNHTNNDQDIANCLMLLAHGHHNMVLPVSPRSFVYECKTCDRGFTSFQALGGHRASHNKPQTLLEKNRNCDATKTLLCNPSSGSTKGSPKVHECSICGSEFTSGQALGGHMRRHRSMTMATTVATSRTPTTCNNASNGYHESKKHKTVRPLDLNLPAPVEDNHKETGISFGSNNQIIVFYVPGLVDCHF